MAKRFVSIWFRHLTTDWFTIGQPHLKKLPFVLRANSRGRMVITAANAEAESKGIRSGMVLADARAIITTLEVQDDKPDLIERLLKRLAEWCIRFTPFVAIDPPDGLLFDVTGCPHLWGGDVPYLEEIVKKLSGRGYDVRAAMADTVGTAWAVARFGRAPLVVAKGQHIEALLPLPPESLRLEVDAVERLHKLGLHRIGQFINMPRASLRRRFGPHFILRLDMALGQAEEMIEPVQPIVPYQERLPCMEPIVTGPGIEIALQQLLETLCLRLRQEQKGLRTAVFMGYRVDGKVEKVDIATNRPSHSVRHLFKLFEIKLPTIEPALGIELFVLEAPKVEDHFAQQEKMWEGSGGLEDTRVSELIDRLTGKLGMHTIRRYVPDEHYWPERSFKLATSLHEKPATLWRADKLRPLQLLSTPERIEVTAPIPDYPPMLFRHNGKIHKIVKADGPERIEQEWWLQQGQHRDYYRVEDEAGHRYWLFRLGHYDDKTYQWFIHGFFA
ncbi:Y-family DNA polymerase [Chryseolinea lacunae]|uniref:DNA polymerase Y family protein n=1 Tax=Chryseolinea lacunae TaxID=2801331 RepID=A0ABS1KWB3_9BACT|nr:DNA polymerase Y family protein [Chryseolinea lacunae]MBL0743552.1 DNA polymerase Y family protein [Chryseolinea lacunae]